MGGVFSTAIIRDGERALVTNSEGRTQIVNGPRRVKRFRKAVTLLTLHTAKPNQFLALELVDGQLQLLRGPAAVWEDPGAYRRVQCVEAHVVATGQFVSVTSDDDGRVTVVEGPATLCPVGARIAPLDLSKADSHQYLAVQFLDGHREHHPGPCAMVCNPLLHARITCHDAINVNSGEMLVVYRQDPAKPGKEGTNVTRRLVPGPCSHVPRPEEWIHEFSWHGRDPSREPGFKKPDALRFTRLRVMPGQFYINVADVRTSDDSLLLCQLMVFYELRDVDRMLDATHDPIGDLINALSADLVSFAVTLPYEMFCEKTDLLNSLGTYPQLLDRAAAVGYHILKIVYRGYQASPALQRMHDQAIQARTQLRLDEETDRQRHQLEDLRLKKEAERQQAKLELERAERQHQLALQREEHAEQLSSLRKQQEAELQHMQQLAALSVDLTKYLVARQQQGSRVINVTSDAAVPALHMHIDAP